MIPTHARATSPKTAAGPGLWDAWAEEDAPSSWFEDAEPEGSLVLDEEVAAEVGVGCEEPMTSPGRSIDWEGRTTTPVLPAGAEMVCGPTLLVAEEDGLVGTRTTEAEEDEGPTET